MLQCIDCYLLPKADVCCASLQMLVACRATAGIQPSNSGMELRLKPLWRPGIEIDHLVRIFIQVKELKFCGGAREVPVGSAVSEFYKLEVPFT